MQYTNFGKFVNFKRNTLLPEVSLNKFALENGIEPSTLSRIENMKQDVKLQTLKKIATGFKTTPAKLLLEFETNK